MLFSPGFLGYKKLLSDSLKETSENTGTLAEEDVAVTIDDDDQETP